MSSEVRWPCNTRIPAMRHFAYWLTWKVERKHGRKDRRSYDDVITTNQILLIPAVMIRPCERNISLPNSCISHRVHGVESGKILPRKNRSICNNFAITACRSAWKVCIMIPGLEMLWMVWMFGDKIWQCIVVLPTAILCVDWLSKNTSISNSLISCLARAVLNWVSKVIRESLWFCITSLSDWFKVLAPLFQPIRSENKNQLWLARAHFPAPCVSYV